MRVMEILFSLMIVIVWPLVGLLLGWWGSFLFLDESYVLPAAMVGLVVGIVYGIRQWRGTQQSLYMMSWLPLLGVLLFYALGMFGFFMGVPVFHALLAIPAGLYWGSRMNVRQFAPSEMKKQRRRLEWCLGGMALMVAIMSGLIAWLDPYTLANLRGMLQLQLTRLFLLLTIVIGGCFMVVGTMVLTRLAFWWGTRRKMGKE